MEREEPGHRPGFVASHAGLAPLVNSVPLGPSSTPRNKGSDTVPCRDLLVIEAGSASLTAEIPEEVMKHVALHVAEAYGENLAQWSKGNRDEVADLIRSS